MRALVLTRRSGSIRDSRDDASPIWFHSLTVLDAELLAAELSAQGSRQSRRDGLNRRACVGVDCACWAKGLAAVGHYAEMRASSARKLALAVSYRGATMVFTDADARSG